jgi:hypothetical protein
MKGAFTKYSYLKECFTEKTCLEYIFNKQYLHVYINEKTDEII